MNFNRKINYQKKSQHKIFIYIKDLFFFYFGYYFIKKKKNVIKKYFIFEEKL